MDFPTVRGIKVEIASSFESEEAIRRTKCVKILAEWASESGFLSRESVKFVVGGDGLVRCRATRFIPANSHIMHAPVRLDMSFTSLRREVLGETEAPNWLGWGDLKARVRMFEAAFRWNPHTYDQRDNFSRHLLLVVTIIGALKKLQDSVDVELESHALGTFARYWHALPCSAGNVLLDWTEKELEVLKTSSFFGCLPDAKRYGVEIFQMIVVPFIAQWPEKFGATIDFETFMRINSIVSSRSVSKSTKACKLVPMLDLVNCKTNDQHNCTLESCAVQKEVDGDFLKFHTLESVCDINAGDEIFLESPQQVGNGPFLLSHNIIPLDPEVIMNNQRTDVFIDFGEFLDMELLCRHPNSPKIRSMKKQHIYGFFNLPKIIAISMDELFSREYTCIPAIRQVLIFLQFSEADAAKAIASSRIKSQFNPHQLFLLFAKFIEISLGKPDISMFRRLLPEGGSAEGKGKHVKKMATGAALGAAVEVGAVVGAPAAGARAGAQAWAQARAEAATGLGAAANSKARASSASEADAGKSEDAVTAGEDGVIGASGGSGSSSDAGAKEASSKPPPLTQNMRSAIFLQMSERLVIEVMINRFIVLFPDDFHELGYSVLSAHLVSTEINAVLAYLMVCGSAQRATICMVCGSAGSMSKCSRCRKAYYCSAACQKEHWTLGHKKLCGKS